MMSDLAKRTDVKEREAEAHLRQTTISLSWGDCAMKCCSVTCGTTGYPSGSQSDYRRYLDCTLFGRMSCGGISG